MDRERILADMGWRRQATCDEPRLSEMAALYDEIGFEIHLEPYRPDGAAGCRGCTAAQPARCWTIYTRRREDAPGGGHR